MLRQESVSDLVRKVYRHEDSEEEIFGLIKAFIDDYAGNETKVSERCQKVAEDFLDKEVNYPKLAGVYRRLSDSVDESIAGL